MDPSWAYGYIKDLFVVNIPKIRSIRIQDLWTGPGPISSPWKIGRAPKGHFIFQFPPMFRFHVSLRDVSPVFCRNKAMQMYGNFDWCPFLIVHDVWIGFIHWPPVWYYLDNKFQLISINFTPKKQPFPVALKKVLSYVFRVIAIYIKQLPF